MTDGELITEVLVDQLNVGGVEYLDPAWRQRMGRFLQRRLDMAWNQYPWPFRRSLQNPATVVIPANVGQVSLPAAAASFGNRGTIYVTGARWELRYVDPDLLTRMRETGAASTSQPYYYTFVPGADGRMILKVYPVNNAQLTFDLADFDVKPPGVLDFPLAPTITVDAGAGAVLTGNYLWAATAVNADGESEAGIVSVLTSPAAQRCQVSVPVAPGRTVTSRKVYRTKAGQQQLLYSFTIPDNVTTAVQDDPTADVALGAAVPTVLTAVTALTRFNERWHRDVFMPGLIGEARDNQGDLRSAGDDAQFMKRVVQMWTDEHPQNMVRRVARFGGSAYR